MIDEELKDIVILAQKVIISYLSPLDGEKRKIVDDVFSQTSVFYADIDVNGIAYFIDKKIVIWQYLKYNYERVLSFLIHEYFHMLVKRDFNPGDEVMTLWLEEGLADTFSDLAINEYFKYNSEKINGRMLHFGFPYISYSGYIVENSFVRTLLYPLSKEGKDKEAIKELLLGSPKKFVEMIIDKETSEKIAYTRSGYPIELFVSDTSMYLNKTSYFQNIDKTSIYYINNAILHRYTINEKIQNSNVPKVYELDKDECYSDEFIRYSYFDNLIISEIRPEELKQFLELYFNSRLPNDSIFLDDAYSIFINKQINYCLENKDQIISNFDKFLDVMPYFISKENKTIGNNIYSIISICLNEMLKKIDKLEYNDSYIHTIYFKLKNIVIPAYESLSNVVSNDEYRFLMELFNVCLQNIESKIMPIDSLIKKVDKSMIIGQGTSKKCYDLENMVLLVGPEYKKFNLDNYYFLNKLINYGVLTPRIISESTTTSEYYILEEKIKGTPLQDYSINKTYQVESEDDILENYYSEKKYVKKYLHRLKELSQKIDILEKFVDDYFTIIQSGGVVDPSKTTNFIYTDKGIYFLDISLNSSNIKMDEHYIFNYILYNISWCQSNCFDNDEQKEEAVYLEKIINELKEICLKRKLNLNEYFIDYNGKPLSYKVEERFKYRDEYKITSEDEYIVKNSFNKRTI